MREIEVLAPAGSFDTMKAAYKAGADAVYMGGPMFGARAYADNADAGQMLSAIDYAHLHGRKLYMTVNTLLKNTEIEGQLEDYIRPFYEQGLDAVIVQDLGVMEMIHTLFPDMAIHASTQMTVCGTDYGKWLRDHGASRIVTPRELDLSEIADMKQQTGVEIETFVHGAMCISYSGRCLLSNFLVGRDANQGSCTHPCRWKYSIVEESRPGEYMPVYENERGTYIFNSKDLCMIEHMDDILTSGIDSLKIEGRMKTALYVATVARTYRKAIDDYLEDPAKYQANMSWYQEQIAGCTYRKFTTGFFYGKPSEEAQIYDNNTYEKGYTYLGFAEAVDERGYVQITQRNKFTVGEMIEIMKPDGTNLLVPVKAIYDEEGNSVESAPHPQQKLFVDLGGEAEVYDILRRSEV